MSDGAVVCLAVASVMAKGWEGGSAAIGVVPEAAGRPSRWRTQRTG